MWIAQRFQDGKKLVIKPQELEKIIDRLFWKPLRRQSNFSGVPYGSSQ